jgi:hypothetical protein
VRVAFDSRPTSDARAVGHYARCLLGALRDTDPTRGEIVETHRPRQAYDVFHAPWMQGAMLHSPCPMVVTIHELGPLTRLSERLRGGGIHLRLRHLAVQRATHVIVPTEALAHEAIAELGVERERVILIPEVPDPAVATSEEPLPASPAWTWQDVGRETWRVYESALAQPERPCVGRLSKCRVGTGGGQVPGGRAPRAIKQTVQ